MKKYIFLALLAVLPFSSVFGATDYYLKLGGVEGETKTSSSTSTSTSTRDVSGSSSTSASGGVNVATGDVDGDGTSDSSTGSSTSGAGAGKVQNSTGGTEAGADMFLEIGGVEGEAKKGNVEYNWKVEEGEKGKPGVEPDEPDEIDYDENGQPITPDFSILLGSGAQGKGQGEENRSEVASIVLQALQEGGLPAEQISLNFEKIQTKVKQKVKLFGFIPVSASATVEIDAQGNVETKFPWWSFLASGKDGDTLGTQVRDAISNVLKTKHDTIKNSIGNIR